MNTATATAAMQQLRGEEAIVLPSLLLCDFGNLERELERLEEAGVKALHLDVMDGQFVPNLTYGMPIVEGIRKRTNLPIDVHLMIAEPSKFVSQFVDAGADCITIHAEVEENYVEVLDQIRELGVGVGLAINPDTALEEVANVLPDIDMLLTMSVNAGFGGQAFNPVVLEKLKTARAKHEHLLLEVDGGINLETICSCFQAGASLFVVGSAIFKQEDYRIAVERLREAIGR